MDNILLAVLGSLVGVIVAVIVYKKQKRKTELTFYSMGSVPLFKKNVKDLEGLRITYNGEDVGGELVIYRGLVFNSGDRDIDSRIVCKPYSLVLPQGYVWRSVSLVNESPAVPALDINGNRLGFKWELLRRREYLAFEGVVEKLAGEGEKRYYGANFVTPEYRIVDLESKRSERPDKPLGMLHSLYLLVGMLFILGLCVRWLVVGIAYPSHTPYMMFGDGNSKVYVTAQKVDKWAGILPSDSLSFKTMDGKTIPETALEAYEFKGMSMVPDKTNYVNIIFSGLILLGLTVGFTTGTVDYLRERKDYLALAKACKNSNFNTEGSLGQIWMSKYFAD